MENIGIEATEKALNSYRNTKDPEIQDFLNNKALTYESRRWCSTYLILNYDMLKQEQTLVIEGYFTLSNKVIEISDNVSNNLKRKLFHGMSKTDNNMHVVLIGQLGKYVDSDLNKISAIGLDDILDYALSIIDDVNKRIVCTCALLEYDTTRIKLRQKYDAYGFKELQTAGKLTQMFIIL